MQYSLDQDVFLGQSIKDQIPTVAEYTQAFSAVFTNNAKIRLLDQQQATLAQLSDKRSGPGRIVPGDVTGNILLVLPRHRGEQQLPHERFCSAAT